MAPKNQHAGGQQHHKQQQQGQKKKQGGGTGTKKQGAGKKGGGQKPHAKKKPGIRAAPHGSPPHGPEEFLADTIFDQFDTVKRDGKLDHKEVKAALESYSEKCGVKKIPGFAVSMAIRFADKNGDGTLNKQEFRVVVKKLSKYASFPDEQAAKTARAHPSDDESDDGTSSSEEESSDEG